MRPSRSGLRHWELLEPRTLLSLFSIYVDSSNSQPTPDGSSGNPYTTIQAAVNAVTASVSTTIYVETGTGYGENVSIPSTDPGLAIQNDMGAAVDTGSGSGIGIDINALNVTISGLTIRDFSTGITVEVGDSAQITGSSITGNSNVGVYVASTGTATITGNSITGNTNYGVEVGGAATIGGTASGASNTISGSGLDGIAVASTGTAAILGNSITGNTNDGIEVLGAATIGGTSTAAA